ncbi:MAG: transaldolase [Treponema sp.]|nr:transaldolase [Treponema sp.]
MTFKQLRVAVYADGADKDAMLAEYKKGYVSGFTTNPSLMKKAGVKDYVTFAKEVVAAIPDLPLSFEVFGDDFDTMEKEAKVISALGKNVFVKIPIMLTDGTSTAPLIKKLSDQGIQLNVTAIFTVSQVRVAVNAFKPGSKNIVSVFAGRLGDSGIDPIPVMRKTVKICRSKKGTMSLWASTRELFNIVEADRIGCDIITVPNSVLAKIPGMGKTAMQGSVDTVTTFAKDIKDLGFSILSK